MFQIARHDRATDAVVQEARAVLATSMAPELMDDRFDDGWARRMAEDGSAFRAVVAHRDGQPVAYCGGAFGSAVATVELVLAQAIADDAGSADLVGELLAGLGEELATTDRVELWGKPLPDWIEGPLAGADFQPWRTLLQMRCPLPVDADPVSSRDFRPGADDAALININNRAFASHPDQGGWTQATLEDRMAEPWFRADGVRLHEIDGRLAGFCWTKIHTDPSLGEIYVIGVDPDFHGRGLGVPTTAAGLTWLHDTGGQSTGMLYVEADNTPAVKTYERLGFTTVRTDRAWVRSNG